MWLLNVLTQLLTRSSLPPSLTDCLGVYLSLPPVYVSSQLGHGPSSVRSSLPPSLPQLLCGSRSKPTTKDFVCDRTDGLLGCGGVWCGVWLHMVRSDWMCCCLWGEWVSSFYMERSRIGWRAFE
uniref:Uncharacterized protein n=1 Tax=Vitrella brassicaformis TaxID=1169539 RepID=A0A7S1KBM6_9ALVE